MRAVEPSVVLVVEDPVTCDDIPVLCARLHRLISDIRPGHSPDGPGLVICDVSGVVRPDLITVDALARLRLTARRLGHRVVLARASPDLLRLLGLVGLRDVLPELGGDRASRGPAVGARGREPSAGDGESVRPRAARAARTGGTRSRCPETG